MASQSDWVRILSVPAAALTVAGAVHATEYLSVEQAQKLMFGAKARFDRRDTAIPPALAREIENRVGVRVRVVEQPTWEVRDETNSRVGYFFVDEVYGKHEFITYAAAIDLSGRVRQIEILTYRETYGYEIRNPAWRAQFVGRTSEDALKLDDDIRNISGATLSCRHVTEGVKRLLIIYDRILRPH